MSRALPVFRLLVAIARIGRYLVLADITLIGTCLTAAARRPLPYDLAKMGAVLGTALVAKMIA